WSSCSSRSCRSSTRRLWRRYGTLHLSSCCWLVGEPLFSSFTRSTSEGKTHGVQDLPTHLRRRRDCAECARCPCTESDASGSHRPPRRKPAGTDGNHSGAARIEIDRQEQRRRELEREEPDEIGDATPEGDGHRRHADAAPARS